MLTKENEALEAVTHMESSNILDLVSIYQNNIEEKYIKLVMQNSV